MEEDGGSNDNDVEEGNGDAETTRDDEAMSGVLRH